HDHRRERRHRPREPQRVERAARDRGLENEREDADARVEEREKGEESFAVAVRKPGRKIGLIPCAVGGTRIEAWRPNVVDSATGYTSYNDAISRSRKWAIYVMNACTTTSAKY
ncbi:MAG: hypothetical protein EOP45_08400, partial [Sphingobacteriaceae bacterium]